VFVHRRDRAVQLDERFLDVLLLALESIDALGELRPGVDVLLGAAIAAIVEIQDLADFGEAEADAAATQDERDAGVVAL